MIRIEEIEFKALSLTLDIAGLPHDGFGFSVYPDLVKTRVFTGVGFNTEFQRDQRLAMPGLDDARVIGNVAALLNGGIEVGFMIKLEHRSIIWKAMSMVTANGLKRSRNTLCFVTTSRSNSILERALNKGQPEDSGGRL